jgi:hypothetical protein
MKIFYYIALSLMALNFNALSNEMKLAEMSLEAIDTLSERAGRPEAIIERRNFDNPYFTRIREEIASQRHSVLALLSSKSTNPSIKALVLRLTQTLIAKEYLAFLDELLRAVEVKEIDKIYLDWALFPNEKHLRDLWSKDENQIERKMLAKKLIEFFEGDKHHESFFRNVAQNKVERPAFGTGAYAYREETKTESIPFSPKGNVTPQKRIGNNLKSGDKSMQIAAVLGGLLVLGVGIFGIRVWKNRSNNPS